MEQIWGNISIWSHCLLMTVSAVRCWAVSFQRCAAAQLCGGGQVIYRGAIKQNNVFTDVKMIHGAGDIFNFEMLIIDIIIIIDNYDIQCRM